MSPKLFTTLLVVTLAAVAAAALTVLARPETAPVHYVDQPAFPELRADPDAVTKVVVTTPEGSFDLVRETGERWVTNERYGYWVDADKVRALIVALADMRLIEAKTERADRHQRLEVEDVDAEGAKSRLVRLESADGKVLAEAIIGKRRFRLTGTEPSGTYLRRPDEDRAWLASGGLEVDTDVLDWLDDRLVDLDPTRIRRIEVRPGRGRGYVLVRDEEGGGLRLADLTPGEVPDPEADLDRLVFALSGARLEDVRPRAELAWPARYAIARFTTFGGLELTVQLAKIDDEPWARFDAREVAPVAPPAPAGGAAAPTDEAGADEVATGPDGAGDGAGDEAVASGESDETTAADEAATGSEATEPAEGEVAEAEAGPTEPTAAELTERLGPWAFRVSDALFERLTTPRADLLKDDDGTS